MNEGPDRPSDAAGRRRISPAHRLLVAMLALQTLALAGLTAFLVFEVFVDRPDSYASAVGLVVVVALATAWLAVITLNTVRGRSWVRAAIVTVQLLQVAVAIGSFQGLFARPDIGWLLLVPAVVVLVLLFTRSVVAATSNREG